MEQKNTKGGLIAGIVLIVIVAFVGVYYMQNQSLENGTKNTATNGENQTGNSEATLQPTFNEISEEVRNLEFTQPVEVLKGPEGSGTEIRSYEIKMEGGAFVPGETVIEKGGQVQVNVVAVDADYDISFAAPLGTYLKVEKGSASVFGFDASKEKVGVYTFTCRDFCPENGVMEGKLIVK